MSKLLINIINFYSNFLNLPFTLFTLTLTLFWLGSLQFVFGLPGGQNDQNDQNDSNLKSGTEVEYFVYQFEKDKCQYQVSLKLDDDGSIFVYIFLKISA